ncbi:PilX N-terminal domain-containing pilus assembly protein [Uruburuella testudinis]|uniref:PilX N-terminal domain-containing pilus assembly protein n=1 Tax=Uruburuella testudinis TaxID=1282863 RepID=A0ABY4DV85_9NEIS|nr:PilX N-terminal domain-containing pilus assembly protein [Uruburuella testudinis]UOO82951.1 PilX N-terminal domain-containing pilus assembly protein [Uruburuella testudinis]
MRRPCHLNHAKAPQQGFALFIVLMMMIVIAFLVVAVTQSYNTEMRIGSNDADRKMAMSLAEAALRRGEGDIADLGNPAFTQNCTGGLCTLAGAQAATQGSVTIGADSSNVAAWERQCGNSGCLESNGRVYAAGSEVSRPPRYIIEFIDAKTDDRMIYRVTARAWGRNANTVVTVQSYVEVAS